VKEAHRLRTLYASRISLLVGLETENITAGDLEQLERLLYEHKEGGGVSYIVGSVHHVNGIPIDFDRPTYERALASVSAEVVPDQQKQEQQAQENTSAPAFTSSNNDQHDRFLSAYFDAQYALLLRFRPEIIGHIDLCRLYTPALRFRDYPQAHARLVRNIQFAAGYGALFEVNAAALRKGWETPYPGEDVVEVCFVPARLPLSFYFRTLTGNFSFFVVQLILSHGGRFALSDDSHGPHAVGLNYTRAAEYLLRVGVSELWFLHPSEVPNASGRHVCAIKAEGKWWEHAFWDSQLSTGENR
jgi:histidinol-phosphatase (PHP family)